MHEYALTKSMIKLVLEEAGNAQAGKVTEIRLVVGELSSVIPECIEMYFELLADGTMLQGARLIFTYIDAELKCGPCGRLFLKKQSGIECPDCGGLGTFTEKGREFYVESIEVE